MLTLEVIENLSSIFCSDLELYMCFSVWPCLSPGIEHTYKFYSDSNLLFPVQSASVSLVLISKSLDDIRVHATNPASYLHHIL